MTTTAELDRRGRLVVLAICCMSLLIVGMDNTIVNVSLQTLHVKLHASLSDLQWTIDAYTLVLASLLILSGSTGDRVGRRRTFVTGLAIFTAASLACSLAPGLGWLIGFRAVQAVGGSMLNPVALSIITTVFTDPRERAFAIGAWGGVVGLGLGLGPVVGGILIDTVGWRGIFLINVPIGLAAIVLALRFVPESRAARPRAIDVFGQVLVVIALALLTWTIIEGPRRGLTAPSTLTTAALVVIAAVTFVRWEQRAGSPLIDLGFFRSVPFSAATVTAVCAFGAFAGFQFLNTLYLQDVRGYSALRAGLCTLPLAIGAIVASPISGRIVGTRGTRIPLVLAGIGMTVAGLLLVGLDAATALPLLLGDYLLFGLGFGFVNAPITNSAVSGMPRSRAGVAAAVASTSRQIGATLGVAVVGSVLNAGLGTGAIGTGFVDAAGTGWWIVVGCGSVVLLLGVASSGPRARRSAAAIAEGFERDDLAEDSELARTTS